MLLKHTRRVRAFTLIELLVVIAIMGLLATMVSVAYSNARRNSRDSSRKSDANGIVSAMQLYRQRNGTYFVTYKQPGTPITKYCTGYTKEVFFKNTTDPLDPAYPYRYLANYTGNKWGVIYDSTTAESTSPTASSVPGECTGQSGYAYSSVNGQGGIYAAHSIASALMVGGYLGSTRTVGANLAWDYTLFRCDAYGRNTYGKNDRYFSLVVNLEHPASDTEMANMSRYCSTQIVPSKGVDTDPNAKPAVVGDPLPWISLCQQAGDRPLNEPYKSKSPVNCGSAAYAYLVGDSAIPTYP